MDTRSEPSNCPSSNYIKDWFKHPQTESIGDGQSKQQTGVIVLAGNPNVGKSVIFNALTGRYTQVSNYPGTTVDIPKGTLIDGRPLHDTPGVYGISNYSEEEQVAQRAILSASTVINVASALSLERDLFLTQQIIDYQKPMVLILNQMDEARAQGIEIDLDTLSEKLGKIPVIPTIATQGQGLDQIVPTLAKARVGQPMPDCPEPAALEMIESDLGQRLRVYGSRRQYVNALVQAVVKRTPTDRSKTLSQKMGSFFLNPVVGLFSTLLVLLSLYQIVGVWVAGDLVGLTEGTIMIGWVVPAIQSMVKLVIPESTPWFTLLAGEFGVLTMTPQYLFGVMFPILLGFYVYISALEDCGWLPRLAVLCDSLLAKIGLNGRAIIPIILGFGCVTMATVSTRVLSSQRERTIASTILAITIPCSAQIAVIVGLMAKAGGLKAWIIFMGILVILLGLLGSALNWILPGKSTSLMMDLPPMRLPSAKNVLRKTWVRTIVFLQEAAPLFMLGSLLVSVTQITGILAFVQKWLAPITESWLHLPGEAAEVFIMGMVRRDFGAAGLYYMAEQLSPLQILTALVTITLFVPCIASATVIWKERGLLESSAIMLGSWLLAFGAGAIVTRVVHSVGLL